MDSFPRPPNLLSAGGTSHSRDEPDLFTEDFLTRPEEVPNKCVRCFARKLKGVSFVVTPCKKTSVQATSHVLNLI